MIPFWYTSSNMSFQTRSEVKKEFNGEKMQQKQSAQYMHIICWWLRAPDACRVNSNQKLSANVGVRCCVISQSAYCFGRLLSKNWISNVRWNARMNYICVAVFISTNTMILHSQTFVQTNGCKILKQNNFLKNSDSCKRYEFHSIFVQFVGRTVRLLIFIIRRAMES